MAKVICRGGNIITIFQASINNCKRVQIHLQSIAKV